MQINQGVFTLHQKSNRIRTGLKPDRGNVHSMRIDRTLHFSRNLTSTLCLRMSRDCHARAVVLLVKNGSSTSSCCTAGVAVGFSTITRTHRALRVSRERRFRAMRRRRQRRRRYMLAASVRCTYNSPYK